MRNEKTLGTFKEEKRHIETISMINQCSDGKVASESAQFVSGDQEITRPYLDPKAD